MVLSCHSELVSESFDNNDPTISFLSHFWTKGLIPSVRSVCVFALRTSYSDRRCRLFEDCDSITMEDKEYKDYITIVI